jgi:putative OPT family oligopeptide transporter
VPLFLVFRSALAGYDGANGIAAIMTVLMMVFGFLFCSVAGYMAGLVGSSNNPVSGVTMATVVVSSLLLLQLMGHDGIAGKVGPAAVIYLAALICTGASIAGDNLQDLKCGHVVGATPWKQQLCLVIGALGSAAVIPLVLGVLDADQGIGRPSHPGAHPLAAPQASLMKDLSTGIFGAGINWNFILFGCGLAVLIIIADKVLEKRKSKFRMPILAVAVGIYLPFGLSVLIFIGGMLSWYVAKKFGAKTHAGSVALENSGMLLASGLITGEAIMGVGIALAVAAAPTLLPTERLAIGGTLAVLATLGMLAYLYVRTLRAARAMQ